MEILDRYLYEIQEGYFFSDKTISVNLSDFEDHTKNKLLIIGVLGSGKTSLRKYLVEKYKVDEFVSDDNRTKFYDALTNSKRSIIEGAGLADLYMSEPSWRTLIIDKPMIIIGMSALKAGMRADKRDSTVPGKAKDWKDIYYFVRKNFSYFQKCVNFLRKDIMKLPNTEIKEYKIPKFETVLN